MSEEKVKILTQLFAACIYMFLILKMHQYKTNAKERDTGNARQHHICGTPVIWEAKVKVNSHLPMEMSNP